MGKKRLQKGFRFDGQVAAILSGKPSLVPGEMGHRDIQVINRIVEAGDSGKSVKFGKFIY